MANLCSASSPNFFGEYVVSPPILPSYQFSHFLAEFIDVGKAQRALDALYDVIKSKKHRTWQKIHEPIMEKYLELCVDLRKSHIAKEGLYQYKNICQQVPAFVCPGVLYVFRFGLCGNATFQAAFGSMDGTNTYNQENAE